MSVTISKLRREPALGPVPVSLWWFPLESDLVATVQLR